MSLLVLRKQNGRKSCCKRAAKIFGNLAVCIWEINQQGIGGTGSRRATRRKKPGIKKKKGLSPKNSRDLVIRCHQATGRELISSPCNAISRPSLSCIRMRPVSQIHSIRKGAMMIKYPSLSACGYVFKGDYRFYLRKL